MGIIEVPDPDFVKQFSRSDRQETAAPGTLIVDAHVDLPRCVMEMEEDLSFAELKEGPFTPAIAREAGVGLFFCALYCEDDYNGALAEGRLREVLDLALDRLGQISIIERSSDLQNLGEEHALPGTLLLVENADALAGNLALVDELKEKGVKVVGLTHTGRNRIAQGAGIPYPDGITDKGKEVIRALQDHRIVLDVAYLHPKCFWQLMDMMEGPVATTHTGIRKVYDLPGNIDLDQAGEIIERGGMVGMTFDPEMLAPEGLASIEDLFVHVDVLVQRFGPESVGIGSGFCGFKKALEGLEDVGKIYRFREMLLRHGYGEDAAAGIMGLNWLRFCEDLLE